MRIGTILVVAAMLGSVGPLAGASRSVSVEGHGRSTGPVWRPPPRDPDTYSFRMEVVSDDRGLLAEDRAGRGTTIHVRDGERYSIRLCNPLPVRAAVGLTVDGLNTITGDPGEPATGSKWLLEPSSCTEIRGFQVGSESARRFVFTSRERSYAHWRQHRDVDVPLRTGQIAAAFFWSSRELEEYRRPQPIVPYSPYAADKMAPPASTAERTRAHGHMARREAGTRMGERLINPVRSVSFDYDSGMFSPSEALVIHYTLSRGPIYRHHDDVRTGWEAPGQRFAPEMPGGERPPPWRER